MHEFLEMMMFAAGALSKFNVSAQNLRAHTASEEPSLSKQATRALKNVCTRGKEIVTAQIKDVRRR